jgi:hypothetical protein
MVLLAVLAFLQPRPDQSRSLPADLPFGGDIEEAVFSAAPASETMPKSGAKTRPIWVGSIST